VRTDVRYRHGDANNVRHGLVRSDATEIEESVNEIAGHLNAQHARLVDHVPTLLGDRRMWHGPGVWTMTQWLAWRTGVSPATAGNIVTIAERIDELPECIVRFRRGELSLEQTSAIAKRAPRWTDRQDMPDGVTFTNRHGRPIAQSGTKPIPPPGPPPPPMSTYRHPTGERFDTRWFEFHRQPGTATAAATRSTANSSS
jgi:hypothetical protein